MKIKNFCGIKKLADLSFNAINLKFVPIVGHKVFYNLWKFQIDCPQIAICTNFLFRKNLGLHVQNAEKICGMEKFLLTSILELLI